MGIFNLASNIVRLTNAQIDGHSLIRIRVREISSSILGSSSPEMGEDC